MVRHIAAVVQWQVTATMAVATLNEDDLAPAVAPTITEDRARGHLENTAPQLGLAENSASSYRFRLSHDAAVVHCRLHDDF